MRNYVKAGPLNEADTVAILMADYGLSETDAVVLAYHARISSTGMAWHILADGRLVWVSALVTVPGKYMIEVE